MPRPQPVLWILAALGLAAASVVPPAHAGAQDRVLVKGLADAEFFETDSGSRLLARNEGDPAGAGRLRLFAAGDFLPQLQGFLTGRVEGGEAGSDGQTHAELEQAFVRIFFPAPTRLTLDAGKLTSPLGNFSRRYLSSVNPLIGTPDSYDVSYPVGVVLTGGVSRLDYHVAVLDSPLTNPAYVPAPERAARPALALGVTPTLGVRIGAYFTQGPYLGSDVAASIPPGAGWRDFEQRVIGLDWEFSRGYFELNGDFAFSSYEVPTYNEVSRGQAWFLEPKYTWSPRFFTALRLERNDYPYIQPLSSAFWIASNAAFLALEVGGGWRFSPDLLLKASYRQDRWNVDESLRELLPDGHAIALQLSYLFHVNSWFERPH